MRRVNKINEIKAERVNTALYPLNKIEQQAVYIYSRLSLSRNRRDSLKKFEISVLRHIRFVVLRKKTIRTAKFHKLTCNLTPLVKNLY